MYGPLNQYYIPSENETTWKAQSVIRNISKMGSNIKFGRDGSIYVRSTSHNTIYKSSYKLDCDLSLYELMDGLVTELEWKNATDLAMRSKLHFQQYMLEQMFQR